jgi:TonB-dependent receptor
VTVGRRRFVGGDACRNIAAALLLTVVSAQAQETEYDFSITSSSVGGALSELARQSGREVLYPYELTRVRGVHPVIGRYSVPEALALLLQGTGFSGGLTSQGVITISLQNQGCNTEGNAMSPETKKSLSILSLLLGTVSASACLTQSAVAQVAAPNEPIETVVVTGIIGSLQNDLNIKRDAPGLVDAISMEDIGHFPDANLANALMRIPGVTTSFTSNMTNNGQSVTTGQGVSITVRGFGPSFNETLFDGRVIPSGVGGRSFDFSGLSADMVSQLQVLKSPDASLSAGAMGATINVIYPKPFDKPGLTVAAAFSGDIDTDDGSWRPNGNFLVSDTFDNDKFGILLAGAYSDVADSQQQFQNWGWIGMTCNNNNAAGFINAVCATGSPLYNKPIWFTQDYAVDFNKVQDEHMNGRIAVQFRPTDALVLTLDANYARDDLNENSLSYALWNSVGEMTNIVTSADGTIVNFSRVAPTDFDDVISQQIQQTYNYGLNGKWTVDDHVTVVADLDQAMSALQPGRGKHWGEVSEDAGYGPSQGACSQNPASPVYNANCAVPNYAGGTNGMNFTVTQPSGSHSVPFYSGIGPNGNLSQFLDTALIGSHVMVVSTQENRNLTNEAKLESDFDYENLSIKIGGSYDANHFRGHPWNSFWGNQWQIYSGYGPASSNYYYGNTNAAAGVALPADLFTGVRPIRSIPGWKQPAGGAIPGLPVFNAYAVYNYINSLGVPTCSSAVPGGPKYVPTPGQNGFNCQFGTGYQGAIPFDMAEDAGGATYIGEDNFAGYMSFATEAQVAGMPLKINGGVRYEHTDLTSSGQGTPLQTLTIDAADHTAYDLSYAPSTTIKETNSYSYLLPNLDLDLFVTDDLHLRFDASRTMTRPPLGNMGVGVSYGGRVGALSATSGNPQELPYLSDNMDVSAEWYYAPNSYVSADVFEKDVSNYIVASAESLTLDGNNKNVNAGIPVIDPHTGTYAVVTDTTTGNNAAADIYGIELAWQHVFGDSGIGYLVNGTIVSTNKPYNPNLLTVGNFGMPGLADSANFMVFYDKDGIEARLAANWRDVYLDSFGQGQSSGTQFGSEPIFINGSWNLTFSTSYDITDNVRAYFEADNLTDATYSTHGRFGDQLYSVISIGRRFTVGLHFKM